MQRREGIDYDVCEVGPPGHERRPKIMSAGREFDAYQEFTRTTAVYPDHGKGSAVARTYCAMGLCGEAGELAEKLKKIIRGGGFDALSTLSDGKLGELQKELGDVVWYVARLADELGLRLSEVTETNVNKLSSRKQRNVIHGEGDNR